MTRDAGRPTGILQEMTIDDVDELDPEVVVLGIGSTEPHGPHLPYGTDVYQTEAVCRRAVTRANERGARALLYPVFPIGNNVNQKAFPFACRIGVDTLKRAVLDVVEAVEEDGIRKVVLVNGHGGNPAALRAALREHAGRRSVDEGAFACLTSTTSAVPVEVAERIEHPSDHAGEGETSRMLHLRPDLVREEHFDAFPVRAASVDELESGKVTWVKPWHEYLPQSAGGETRESSAEKGEALVDGAADWIAELLVELTEVPREDIPYVREE